MPSHAAMIEKPLVFSLDTTVEDALKDMDKKKQSHAAVLDEEGRLVGKVSHEIILSNLLHVSVAVNDGIPMDIPVNAAPGIAKRLKKLALVSLEQVMERKKIAVVMPETPVWECVNRMLTVGAPVFVIEDQSGKFLGTITAQSIVHELDRLHEGGA